MRHDTSYIIELVRYNIIVMTITVYNIILYGVGLSSRRLVRHSGCGWETRLGIDSKNKIHRVIDVTL